MKKLFTKLIAFAVILFFVYRYVDIFFEKDFIDAKSYNSFYNQPNNSIDVLFLGNSHSEYGIYSNYFDANSKVNSFNLSFSGIGPNDILYNLKETLKYHTPKLVAIEAWPFINDKYDTPPKEMKNKSTKSFMNKRLGLPKIEEFLSSYPYEEIQKLSNISFRHDKKISNLNELGTFIKETKKTEAQIKNGYAGVRRGYTVYNYTTPKSFKNSKKSKMRGLENKGRIIDYEQDVINEIKQLGKEYNFEILFYTIAIPDVLYPQLQPGFQRFFKQMKTKYGSEFHYLNMNEISKDNEFDVTAYMPSPKYGVDLHLNKRGSIKATKKLSEYLTDSILPITYHNNNNTQEYFILNDIEHAVSKTKDTITGSLYYINGNSFDDHQKLKRDTSAHIFLQGYLDLQGNSKNNQKIYIILVEKNTGFIHINSYSELKKTNKKDSKVKEGKINYEVKIPSCLLEKGTYMVYQSIKLKSGEILVSKANSNTITID